MNVDTFTRQIQVIHKRLDALYSEVTPSAELKPDLLPLTFKELGIASEELQTAIEELTIQNEELIIAQSAVSAERQRYEDLFQCAPDGYLVTNELGVIEEANRAAAELLNVSQRFLVGKPLIVFVAEQERQMFHRQLTLMQQVQRDRQITLQLLPRNGELIEVDLRAAAITDWQGKSMIRMCLRSRNTHQVEVASETNELISAERPKQIYLKGEIIPLQPKNIWQVCQGVVKLSTINEKGEEVLVGLAGAGMLFSSDLTSLKTYQAIALIEVELICFSLAEITTSPTLAQAFLPKITQRLQQTESLLAISGHRHVKDRFAQLLQLLKQEVGEPVAQGTRLSVRFTHQDFADACSTTRVTITRLLGKLQKQGQIFLDSKNHIILVD